MSNNVVDMLSRRANRHETVIHFGTASEALAFATEQLRDLQRLADSALLVAACDLELPLAQVTAVLTECMRLHSASPQQENGR